MTPEQLVSLFLHKSFFGYLLGTFVGLVTIANPLSKIPLFMSLTGEMQRLVQKDNARRAAVYAFGLLTTCLFIGALVLEVFGISYGALRIAGGITILSLGYRMFFEPGHAPIAGRPGSDDIAFFPLAFPGISGPGTIAFMIGISTEIAELRGATVKASAYGATILSTAAMCLVMWAVYRSARGVSRVIGPQGMEAMTRMMGFLLICIGVQFIGSGIRSFVAGS